ncbi:putative LRR receptor-like serine/threonine-protein kinase [Apostasia shenzhenica]|uniref:Putative LRR receptor-like serine/threonine-protein kinase n=1 Tax=Apostasia shenzhenica TaxID=1088818 RepID=A0A2I0A8N7_9ASPA|nr:putative LRR receptor-like serine/threonine-protein kinase [Apostasia shenzhenica]
MEKGRLRFDCLMLLLVGFSCLKLGLCGSRDAEGWALLRFRDWVELDPYGALSSWGNRDVDHCFWYGVACSEDGKVVSLILNDLCLKGTLASEIGKLSHLKSLILHNNSFSGIIPGEISELQKLEVLDLGYNNLSGPLPVDLIRNLSLKILVLSNNRFINDIPPELCELNMHSQLQTDGKMLCSNGASFARNVDNSSIRRLRRLLQEINQGRGKRIGKKRKHNKNFPPQSHSPVSTPSPAPSPSTSLRLVDTASAPAEASAKPKKTHWVVFVSIGVGLSLLVALSSVYFLCCRTNKVVSVMPWKTGLSGQLQKALVTGVPSLKRSELEIACECFSNVIGSLSGCSLYKGTLSSGVEIAVTSSMIKSEKDWSNKSEELFRKKISVLSKLNHKNFMNLLGYCEEQEHFTRMMVYEYSPNGTLFEHLHIKEAEPLDWTARLRIAMGIAYCLEYMLRLDPPVILSNLNSSTIILTEDYAAKVSDLSFWNEEKATNSSFENPEDFEPPLANQEDIVYKFGIILLELVSGRLPFSKDYGLLVLWASCYLSGKRPINGMIDQTLISVGEEDVSSLCEVIRSCVNPEAGERPTMAEVVSQLRKITAIAPEAAFPRLSPLWWAELEIISSESAG